MEQNEKLAADGAGDVFFERSLQFIEIEDDWHEVNALDLFKVEEDGERRPEDFPVLPVGVGELSDDSILAVDFKADVVEF